MTSFAVWLAVSKPRESFVYYSGFLADNAVGAAAWHSSSLGLVIALLGNIPVIGLVYFARWANPAAA
jgi:hypothetical protein